MIIGYFADGPWSHQALDKLRVRENLDIAFICGRFNNPDQRLKEMAEKYKIPFLTNQNINSPEFLKSIEHLDSRKFSVV